MRDVNNVSEVSLKVYLEVTLEVKLDLHSEVGASFLLFLIFKPDPRIGYPDPDRFNTIFSTFFSYCFSNFSHILIFYERICHLFFRVLGGKKPVQNLVRFEDRLV